MEEREAITTGEEDSVFLNHFGQTDGDPALLELAFGLAGLSAWRRRLRQLRHQR